jgi:hypothetical protein
VNGTHHPARRSPIARVVARRRALGNPPQSDRAAVLQARGFASGNASTTLFKFDGDKLTLSAKQTTIGFKAIALKVWGKDLLYVGGEAFDNCWKSYRVQIERFHTR